MTQSKVWPKWSSRHTSRCRPYRCQSSCGCSFDGCSLAEHGLSVSAIIATTLPSCLSIQPRGWVGVPPCSPPDRRCLPSQFLPGAGGEHPRTRKRPPLFSFRCVPVKKPAKRPVMPPRGSNNDKRRLIRNPEPGRIELLLKSVRYQGYSKHKLWPHLFGLEPFRGKRGDATLCDKHANFRPEDFGSIDDMIKRGLRAGLVGHKELIWAIADNGWIYEARVTNVGQTEYHGYPVRDSEAIAEPVYRRFAAWAQESGDQVARLAAENCKRRYGFK